MVKSVARETRRQFRDLRKVFGGGDKSDLLPEEDPTVRVLRDRQIRELADLDEEENRRLKTAFRRSRGIRAFRRSGSGGGGSVSSSSGQTGQRAFVRSGSGPRN